MRSVDLQWTRGAVAGFGAGVGDKNRRRERKRPNMKIMHTLKNFVICWAINNISLRKLCVPVRSGDFTAERWEKSGRAMQWNSGTDSLYNGLNKSYSLA